jgi:acyl carrier protein
VPRVDEDVVLDLLVERIRRVMLLEHAPPGDWRALRFDEDLHADSLDLVEIVEGVEADLRRRGHAVAVGDADLAGVRAVGDAVDVLVASASGSRSERSMP